MAEGSNSAPGAVRLKIVERPGKDNFTDKPLDGGFKKSSSSSGDYSSDNNFTASLSMRRRSKEERFETLGENKFVARAEGMTMGVLPILKAFQTFDKDKSGGLSVEELKEALEHLGIDCTMEFASQVLRQYDSYPDQVIDVSRADACRRALEDDFAQKSHAAAALPGLADSSASPKCPIDLVPALHCPSPSPAVPPLLTPCRLLRNRRPVPRSRSSPRA